MVSRRPASGLDLVPLVMLPNSLDDYRKLGLVRVNSRKGINNSYRGVVID